MCELLPKVPLRACRQDEVNRKRCIRLTADLMMLEGVLVCYIDDCTCHSTSSHHVFARQSRANCLLFVCDVAAGLHSRLLSPAPPNTATSPNCPPKPSTTPPLPLSASNSNRRNSYHPFAPHRIPHLNRTPSPPRLESGSATDGPAVHLLESPWIR